MKILKVIHLIESFQKIANFVFSKNEQKYAKKNCEIECSIEKKRTVQNKILSCIKDVGCSYIVNNMYI